MPNHSTPDALSRLTEIMLAEPAHSPAPAAPPERARRRRRNRRRGALIAGIVVLALAGSAGGYAAWALNAPIGTATVVAEAPTVVVPEAAQLDFGADTLAGAISVVSGGGEFLPAEVNGTWGLHGSDEPRPIASITKLITALVILDRKPLGAGEDGPRITFSRADNALYDKYYVLGATIAAMPTGSSLSQHDAMEAMLVVSACNYAEALSTWAFGSQGAFLQAARGWLTAQGLSNTAIVEPTGLDPRNTSTPTDLLQLGRLAMANPVIAEIAAMTSLKVPTIEETRATNTLLGVDGVTGLKTGTLEDTGANLLFSATIDAGIGEPIVVVGVLLGGYTRESNNFDAQSLLASIRDGFHTVTVGEARDEVGTYTTPWGESAAVVLRQGAALLTWSDTPVTSTYRVDTITTGRAGDVVGEITWTAGDRTASVDLVLAGDIDPPDEWWRLTHPGELGG